MSFTVVITTHHDPEGCYLTTHSLLAQLRWTPLANPVYEHAEFIVVADGGDEYKWEKIHAYCLRGVYGSPQASRDAGIRAASHPTVLVVESHVIVSDPLQLIKQHRELNAALTFPTRVSEGPDLFDVYGCETDWDKTLWFKWLSYTRPAAHDPYRVSQFGHSCFVVDRDFYIASGGYTDLLKGWGGEEQFLALKFWMLGRELWMVPATWHAHYLTRGAHAGRTSEDEYKHNLAVVAYVIAGRQPPFMITPAMQAERARVCGGPFSGDLAKLRTHLTSLGVN